MRNLAHGFFPEVVTREFAFLISDHAMKIIEQDDTRVRFESEIRFVDVFWGRRSYEISVEFGRWIRVAGKVVEDKYYLQNLLALEGKSELLPRAVAATEEGAVARLISREATLTKEHAQEMLRGSDTVFTELTLANSAIAEEGRADQLRRKASFAWSEKNYEEVERLYGKIDNEIPTISLLPSERAKLNYASKLLRSHKRVFKSEC